MSQPKRKRLNPEQRQSYESLKRHRAELMDSIDLFTDMMRTSNKELREHLARFHGDPRERASDGLTPVPGMVKMPLALVARASIKSLLESLVVLDQKLAVFEGTGNDEEEAERETRSGQEASRRLLEAMDARAAQAAQESPQRPGQGVLDGDKDDEEAEDE